jgi:DNA ligase-associated metallophosphoesterase
MSQFVEHRVLGNTFILSHDRSIFWEEEKALIVSDLHFGKSGHFRKNGIGIPQNVFKEDLQRLFAAIQFHRPQQLIIVGDMFHSKSNSEHDLFLKWRNDLPSIHFHLVMGNHDILSPAFYEAASLAVHRGQLQVGDFVFTHDIADIEIAENYFYFSGHIHPGIRMAGLAKQAIQVPCFYFNERYAILPAFGKFTGTHAVAISKRDKVFALAANKVLSIQ